MQRKRPTKTPSAWLRFEHLSGPISAPHYTLKTPPGLWRVLRRWTRLIRWVLSNVNEALRSTLCAMSCLIPSTDRTHVV
ncbi:hypothetical protein [Paenibacillus motobuensis]|uniref:hypothetical protein n=1 Tax=Paenibacillus motobuensis TaxID=295324 RepID=UPI0031DB1CA9